MNIGEKIRQIRQLKGLSQENVASELQMSAVAFGDIERGKSSPSFDRLEKIAQALGVKVNDLISFEDRVNNFFEHCQHPNVNATTFGNNHYHADEKEVRHQLELERMEAEKKVLIIEKLEHQIDALQAQISYLKDKMKEKE